jgi:hypothetical protein
MVISPSLATRNGGSINNVLLFAAGELFIVIVMMALTALALVFMLAIAMYYWADAGSADRAQKLLEACQQIIPPLLTLAIGFCFGQKR